ncbi:MAG: hypothetical protein BWY42_01560 [Candidatus Omnitrophica bacterium ADurb.Bin277]|nr:MAG: hypothetical protein BWY42_01560 [Candidatus Omnitrophica bacterium ADurb.Bin277]
MVESQFASEVIVWLTGKSSNPPMKKSHVPLLMPLATFSQNRMPAVTAHVKNRILPKYRTDGQKVFFA